MDNRKTVLEVNDLVVSFSMYKKGFRKENLEVIHSLSIDVKEKEIVAIVGSSGSGKSLLASAILGLLPGNASTSGSVCYMGKQLDDKLRKQYLGRDFIYSTVGRPFGPRYESWTTGSRGIFYRRKTTQNVSKISVR